MAEEDGLHREVDEALREDRLKQQWKALAPLIALIVGVVIVGVGGNQLWGYMQKNKAQEASAYYFAAEMARNEGELEKANQLYAKAKHNGFGVMASMYLVDDVEDLPSDHEMVVALKSVHQPSNENPSHMLASLEIEQLAMQALANGDDAKAYDLLQGLNNMAGAPPSQMERVAELIKAVELKNPELVAAPQQSDDEGEMGE